MFLPLADDAAHDPNDIGYFIGKKCTDNEKYRFLKTRFLPDEQYKFPVSGDRNLKFQRKWLIEFLG